MSFSLPRAVRDLRAALKTVSLLLVGPDHQRGEHTLPGVAAAHIRSRLSRDARRKGPAPPRPGTKGALAMEHQDETPWQSLVARLVEVVLEARAWAARAEGSPPSST
ncbi:hypothetical protein GCM10010344_63290 [Streptomyces bluensis]|nr:hypothetical protein GCM10010344_63290 [Streptomyces bluensis]